MFPHFSALGFPCVPANICCWRFVNWITAVIERKDSEGVEESTQSTRIDQITPLACYFSTYPPSDCIFWCSRKLLIWSENLIPNRPGMSFPGWNREHREAGHQNLPEQWELFQSETLLTSATGTTAPGNKLNCLKSRNLQPCSKAKPLSLGFLAPSSNRVKQKANDWCFSLAVAY